MATAKNASRSRAHKSGGGDDDDVPASLASSIINAITSFGTSLWRGKLHESDLPSDSDDSSEGQASDDDDDDDDEVIIIGDDNGRRDMKCKDMVSHFMRDDEDTRYSTMYIFTGKHEDDGNDFTKIVYSPRIPLDTLLKRAEDGDSNVVNSANASLWHEHKLLTVCGDAKEVRAQRCFVYVQDHGRKTPLKVFAKECILYAENTAVVFQPCSRDTVFYVHSDKPPVFRSKRDIKSVCGVQMRSNGVRELHRVTLATKRGGRRYHETILIGDNPQSTRYTIPKCSQSVTN